MNILICNVGSTSLKYQLFRMPEELVLASGGANGADQTAQAACVRAGGNVIVFTAGRLLDCAAHARVLYVSEGGCELPFSTPRA